MILVTRLGDHVYKDVASGQIFTTIAGLAKMLSVSHNRAESIVFSYPHRILEQGILAGAVKSPEVIAKDLLARLVLAESEVACSTQTLAQALGLTDSPQNYSRLLVYISSHLAAKIILDSDTASSPVKRLAQGLLLTNSLVLSEEFLRAINEATPPVARPWMEAMAS